MGDSTAVLPDDDWDGPTDVTAPTWIIAAEHARQEQAALASIQRAQLTELAPPPPVRPAGRELHAK